MNRKLAASVVVMLFLFSSVAVTNPVQAHFTLGDLTATYRYRSHDFDPHVPGVIGYVWPGAGQNAYSGGFGSFANVNLGPGYQSPYPGLKPPSPSPGASFLGGAPSTSWYQLEGDAYAPFGAVLAGSTGDLIFALNATAGFIGRWDTVAILIPPGFSISNSPQIVSTITNDYSGIAVSRLGPYDRYAPGWTVVEILSDTGMSSRTQAAPVPPAYYDHQAIDFTAAGEWYYVRINGVLAPSVAGRYFFKILLVSTSASIGGEEGTAGIIQPGSNCAAAFTTPPALLAESCSQFIPTENWPVMLVKGEIDPAIITGTIRYAGYNATLYSSPIREAGRVYAKMTSRLDPYTGQARPDLPLVDAVAYFNATAQGHYEVEGLAPGVYDLYASAAGYPETLIQSSFTVLKGQSLHFDGYLQPGPVIHGNVFTKHQFGDQPWPGSDNTTLVPAGAIPGISASPGTLSLGAYIKIELYDAPTLSHIPDSKANMVSWSPLPCVAGGQQRFYGRNDAGFCDDPRDAARVAFPWHEYTPANGYDKAGLPFFQVSAGDTLRTYWNDLFQDPQGVGPAQHWYVVGGTTTPFHFEFGAKGEYGAPRDLDGMVPQMYATWVNGLTPGRYYARAWTFRYVQSALDGATFQEYYFDVTPQEWAGDVALPIDLRLSSWVNKTVHFHNVINGITEDPIGTGAGMMSGVLADSNKVVWSYNQTLLGYENLYTTGARSGWGAAAFSTFSTTIHRNDLDKARLNRFAIETGRANFQFWGWNDTWGGENYGIPSGTYTPHVYALGYVEKGPVEQVSVTLSGNPTSISDHMYRGAGFNLTVYSIDWERPRVSRQWVWGNAAGYTASGPATTAGALGNNVACLANPVCAPYAGMVGQEIDVGIYRNGTLMDFIGDEPSGLQDTVLTSCLFQASITTQPTAGLNTNSSVQMCGGGWEPLYAPLGVAPNIGGVGYVLYQGNTNDAYFGQELASPGYVGGELTGFLYFETTRILFGPAHYGPSNLPDGGTYSVAAMGFIDLYPTAIPPGQYDLRGYTYGYIQDKSFSAYASSGQVADIKINMVVGVNVTLDILFKKEHIITPTAANMSARVRLFDDSGSLVAEWMSSEGTYATGSNPSAAAGGFTTNTHGFAHAADGTYQYPFGPLHPVVIGPTNPNSGNPLFQLNTYNYLPGGVTLLHVLMAGLPQVPAAGTDAGVSGSGVPQRVYFNDPVYATTTCGFEVDCYTTPGAGLSVGVPGYFPNTGILGAPSYQGGWTAEVDFVNWYANNTAATNWGGTFPAGPLVLNGASYYPPVAGLLMGESYHIIPGTTAKSGISLTEDAALKPELVGHTIAANHLGPYSQQGVWQISGTHLSGEASGIFEVDLNGLVSGNALAFSWSNEFRPLSWGTITVTGAGLPTGGLNFYTYDGVYQAYLPSVVGGLPGSVSYTFTLGAPGYAGQTWTAAVSAGQAGTGANVYLEQSNIPVPEFSGIAVVAFSALAASLYLLRRRRR